MMMMILDKQGVDWILLALDRDQWWAVMNMAVNVRFQGFTVKSTKMTVFWNVVW
jgi:hypothetical protein